MRGSRPASNTSYKKRSYGGDNLVEVPLVKKVTQLNESDEEDYDTPVAPIIKVESDDSGSVNLDSDSRSSSLKKMGSVNARVFE